MPRVCMVGLDCLAPDLVFSRFWGDLPNLRALVRHGCAGPLRSCDPPITVPAWAVMLTGQDPGSLGVYGFYDRADHSYHRRRLASSVSYTQPPIWQTLSAVGRRCRLLAIPQTYPPQPLYGTLLTGALTPPAAGLVTYPSELAASLAPIMGAATVDVAAFRTMPATVLLAQVRRNSRALFRLVHYTMQQPWDFLALVDMGADRLHHCLWQLCMDDHPSYRPGHPLAGALRSYYRLLDRLVGGLRRRLRPDDVLWVVSDHGAQAMQGAVAINMWLVQQGYLCLRGNMPDQPTAFDPDAIDWPRSRAWADGGYAARIYLNVRGREPQGCVEPHMYEATLSELTDRLALLPRGGALGPHVVLRPRDIYGQVRGVPPDLLVYLSNLRLRALASFGHPQVFCQHNDRGPDGANHALHGLYIRHDGLGARPAEPLAIYDIAPQILASFGLSSS